MSFVYLHAGPAFAKKGEMQMTLPRMDVPVSVVEWELFLPGQYRADRFAGTAIAAYLVESGLAVPAPSALPVEGFSMGGVVPGQIVGRVLDAQGGVVPGATIVAEVSGQRRTAVTGADGQYIISNLPSGPLSVTSQLSGFKTAQRSLVYDQRPRQIDFQMALGGVEETITVQAEAPVIDMRSAETSQTFSTAGGLPNNNRTRDEVSRRQLEQRAQEPSLNVQSLQRRAAGVLPVRIDVPRAGTSHRFLKPLVVDEETVVQFRYHGDEEVR